MLLTLVVNLTKAQSAWTQPTHRRTHQHVPNATEATSLWGKEVHHLFVLARANIIYELEGSLVNKSIFGYLFLSMTRPRLTTQQRRNLKLFEAPETTLFDAPDKKILQQNTQDEFIQHTKLNRIFLHKEISHLP